MNKVAIIYWSGSGNTEAMAKAMQAGVEKAGAAADLFFVSDFNVATAKDYDGFLLGCPAMGAEVLEECEFQPVYDELEPELNGKPVGLFGSYGWGSGEWMETWEAQVNDSGAKLVAKGLIINETPDDDGLAECEAFADKFVKEN